MIVLLLGVATLLVLMAALGMFSRAQIDTLKIFGVWVVALGGLVLAAESLDRGRALGVLDALVATSQSAAAQRPPKG